ncbi:MAG TPA: flagellar biosynthetic protein FliO [Patescibacteria group bacterium]|nr:flagellar biosynthetic protein FliO [Patescibacteria group bacterium]
MTEGLSGDPAIFKALAAFAFVMCLMYLLAYVIKRLGLGGPVMLPGAKRRLKVVEHLAIDPRRKLVIVRRDNKEHLLVLGPGGETVIESNIQLPDNVIELADQKDVKNG